MSLATIPFQLGFSFQASMNLRTKAAFRCGAHGLFLLLIVSPFVVTEARTIVVGGQQGWRFGFNYSDWALQNSPFSINDMLVFKYPPPGNTSSAYSVYLLPKPESYKTCDFRRSQMVANAMQGSGRGFEFVLNRSKAYYFASGTHNGFRCREGLMKFSVIL